MGRPISHSVKWHRVNGLGRAAIQRCATIY